MRKVCDCGKKHTAATKKCPDCIQAYRQYRRKKKRTARVAEASRYSMIPGGGDAWRLIDAVMPGRPDTDRDHLIPYSLCEKLFHWLIAADRIRPESRDFSFDCAQHVTNVKRLDDTKNRQKSNVVFRNLVHFVFDCNDKWYDFFDDPEELISVAKGLGFTIRERYSLTHYDNYKVK